MSETAPRNMKRDPAPHVLPAAAADGSSKNVLRLDLVAGLTASAVVVPKALGRERLFFNVQTAVQHFEQIGGAEAAAIAGGHAILGARRDQR